MLSQSEFLDGVINGNYPSVEVPTGGFMPGDFDGFDGPGEEVRRSFAHGLLEASGFGTGQEIDRNDIVKSTEALAKHLPPRVYFWDQAGRAHWTILVEFEQSGRVLLQQPLFRSEKPQQGLEEVAYRAIQGMLAAFERGGEQKGATVKKGAQTETVVVVSIPDDRKVVPDSTEPLPRLVYFGTRSTETNALEVFVLKEAARAWDPALRDEHFKQVYQRHFSKLGTLKWQDAFVTGPERKLAEKLRESAQVDPIDEGSLKKAVGRLLDELSWSYGLKRRKDDDNRCLSLKDLERGHALGVPIAKARTQGFENPLRGVALYDADDRLRGFVLYVVDPKADRGAIRDSLKANNRLHNVLVLYPGEADPEIEVWQGSTVLRGRLLKGGRLSTFEGDGGIVQLLSRFLAVSESSIDSDTRLAEELAARANTLKDLALDELKREIDKGKGPLKALHDTFSTALATLTPEKFADAYAQAITYGMLSARWLSSERTDLLFTRKNLPQLLPSTSPFLRRLYSELVVAKFDSSLQWLLDELVSLLARTDVERVFKTASDPAIHFYEDFLDAYNPDLRQKMGVYYTPKEVVNYIVRAAHQTVIDGFGLPLGLADTTRWGAYAAAKGITKPPDVSDSDYVVQILDPAVGTGTFPLRVLEVIFETMTAQWTGLPDEEAARRWKAYVHEHLLPRLNAFELMMAPYIVCHLRLGLALERGLARDSGRSVELWGYDFAENDRLRVFLTNTLELRAANKQMSHKGLGEAIAQEAADADLVKGPKPISVIIGNPPYDHVSSADEALGGWVKRGDVPGRPSGQTLFKDLQDANRSLGVVFSKDSHLNNLFVYFLRWAYWQVFESRPGTPGVVSMITPNAWFDGDGFVGLRRIALDRACNIWCIDLGGDSRGASADNHNVFHIQTGVGISVSSRALMDHAGGITRYRRLSGSTDAKLSSLKQDAHYPLSGDWQTSSLGHLLSLVPCAGGSDWGAMPGLEQIMPWQQPGCMFSRLWTIAPAPDTLLRRWERFVGSNLDERPDLYQTPTHGRNIFTKVGNLPKLASLKSGAVPPRVDRYGWRSFDRQWAFADPRLAKTESPSLWACSSESQVYLCVAMTKETSGGPLATISAYVPDKDYFRGSFGGKDVIPLYRDSNAGDPNITRGLASGLASHIGLLEDPSCEDIVGYLYAVLSSPRYQERFAEALAIPGPKVPITRSSELWHQAVECGRRLVWLHTYGERFRDSEGRYGPQIPYVEGLRWISPITSIPKTPNDISYDPATQTLVIGNGQVGGVRREVWEYRVSGFEVVYKWIGYRTLRGAGRAASSKNPLDRIRSESWLSTWNAELLELLNVLTYTIGEQRAQAVLLDRICDGPLISATELPQPEAWQRKVPIADDGEDDEEETGQQKIPGVRR